LNFSKIMNEEGRMASDHDPRSEAEKARAALKRNAEMDSSTIPMSPITRQPSVTPESFGEHGAKTRALSGSDQGIEAGGAAPGGRSPGATESIVEADQVAVGRDSSRSAANQTDDDALTSRK
jgi:hypothetical protein